MSLPPDAALPRRHEVQCAVVGEARVELVVPAVDGVRQSLRLSPTAIGPTPGPPNVIVVLGMDATHPRPVRAEEQPLSRGVESQVHRRVMSRKGQHLRGRPSALRQPADEEHKARPDVDREVKLPAVRREHRVELVEAGRDKAGGKQLGLHPRRPLAEVGSIEGRKRPHAAVRGAGHQPAASAQHERRREGKREKSTLKDPVLHRAPPRLPATVGAR